MIIVAIFVINLLWTKKNFFFRFRHKNLHALPPPSFLAFHNQIWINCGPFVVNRFWRKNVHGSYLPVLIFLSLYFPLIAPFCGKSVVKEKNLAIFDLEKKIIIGALWSNMEYVWLICCEQKVCDSFYIPLLNIFITAFHINCDFCCEFVVKEETEAVLVVKRNKALPLLNFSIM